MVIIFYTIAYYNITKKLQHETIFTRINFANL